MRRVRSAVAAVSLLLLVALAGAAPASAEKYVAMGDSYSAGTGTNNYDYPPAGTCQRSYQAYGPLIRSALGAQNSFKFAACSGAVVSQVTTQTQGGNPGPQVSMLGNDTLDATITIGGNDAGFGDVLLQCGYPMVSCDGDLDTAQAFISNTLPDRLNNAYNLIRQNAPNARIGVVSYPRLFPADGDDCSAATFFSSGEITRMNQMADLLADVTRVAARAHGFAFIDARQAFLGHAWCEDEWINGLSNPTNNSYHPNPSGYEGFAGIVRGAMLATPAPSFSAGANGRIAFATNRDGNSEIYVVNGNGAFPVNLTNDLADDRVPSFSPDGTRIAYASNRDGNYEIYTMDSTGGNRTRLTDNAASDFDPAWSPNGKQIVFRSDRDGDNEIYKVNSDGSDLWNNQPIHKLTSNSASDFAPSFSPDGAEIAFQRYTAGSGNGQGNEVYKMNADGQGQVNLTNNAAAINDGAPEWSPDGSRIAFHSNRIASNNFEIYTMAATGGTATRRTSATGDDTNPTWAPSGSHIAFQSDRDGEDQIYTMTPTGSSQVRRSGGGSIDQVPTWQGDATPPQTTIDSGPLPVSNNPIATLTFSSDEAGSAFECKLDGAAFTSCSSPYTSASLGDGSHDFAVRAIDPSGNADGVPATSSFAIDTAAKVSEITAGPSGPTSQNQPQFEFTSEDPTVTFECRLDPGSDPAVGWEACTSPHQIGLPTALADGPHGFQVRGTDGVGNVETGSPVRLFTVDTVAPESAITFGPPASGPGKKPDFEFTSDEPGSTFECRLDIGPAEGSWQSCESPWAPGELGEGQYTVNVRATDQAGNLEIAPATTSFAIDTTAPETTISSGPGAAEPNADVTFVFAADDSGSRYECRLDVLDDSEWSACTSPKTYPGLNHGRHAFQVRAIDAAGNVELDPANSDFGVKTSPGYAITEKPDAVTTDRTPEFKFESTDPDAWFECRLDSDAEADWEPCASPFPEPPVPPAEAEEVEEGEHVFELRGHDYFGDVEAVQPYGWTVADGPPQASIVSGPSGLVNSGSAVFEVDGGLGSTALDCRIDGYAWTPCDPAAPAGTRHQTVSYSGLEDAEHDFRVRARGPLGLGPLKIGPEAKRIWSTDQTAPRADIDRAPPRQVASTSASFEFSERDSESGVTFRCRVDAANGASPSGFADCQSPFEVSSLTDGDHRFDVVAVDPAGNVSPVTSRIWTVDTIGPVVRLAQSPPARTSRTDADFAFDTEDRSVAFACSLDEGEWRPCTSPFAATRLTAGDHSFGVRAVDALGNTGEPVTHSWTVTRMLRPSISFRRQVKLKPRGATRVATVTCPAGSSCHLAAPKRATLRVKAKRFKVRVKATRRIAAGRKAAVAVIVSKSVRRVLRGRSGKLKIKLKASAKGGSSRIATGTVRLRR